MLAVRSGSLKYHLFQCPRRSINGAVRLCQLIRQLTSPLRGQAQRKVINSPYPSYAQSAPFVLSNSAIYPHPHPPSPERSYAHSPTASTRLVASLYRLKDGFGRNRQKGRQCRDRLLVMRLIRVRLGSSRRGHLASMSAV